MANTLFQYLILNMMNRLDLTMATLREVAIIQERVDVLLKKNLPAELPAKQFKLLNHLINTTNKDETASEIAHNSQVSLSAMSQIIKQLTLKGYVELQTRKLDTRKKSILISEQGRIAHRNALAKVDMDLKAFSAKFNLEDLQQLFNLSNKFRRLVEDHF